MFFNATYNLLYITISIDPQRIDRDLFDGDITNIPEVVRHHRYTVIPYDIHIALMLQSGHVNIDDKTFNDGLSLEAKIDKLKYFLHRTYLYGENTDIVNNSLAYNPLSKGYIFKTNTTAVIPHTSKNLYEHYNSLSEGITSNSYKFDSVITPTYYAPKLYRYNKHATALALYLDEILPSIVDIKMQTNETTYSKSKYQDNYDIFETIRNKIRSRYALISPNKRFKPNTILDTFLPKMLQEVNFNLRDLAERTFPKSSVMIHRGFAEAIGIPAIPTINLLEMVGYTKDKIKDLLIKTKKQKHEILFAGMGGVSNNTLYWLYEMCTLCGISGLFSRIFSIDDDRMTLDNILRMPAPFSFRFTDDNYDYMGQSSNVDIANMNNDLYRRPLYSIGIDKVLLMDARWEKVLSAKKYIPIRGSLDKYTYLPKSKIKSIIAYGAPEVGVRSSITDNSNIGAFLCAVHSNNTCSMIINPKITTDELKLMNETYGIIQLNVFFLNQIRLAIELLEILAENSVNDLSKDIIGENITTLDNYSILDKKISKYDIAYTNRNTIGD